MSICCDPQFYNGCGFTNPSTSEICQCGRLLKGSGKFDAPLTIGQSVWFVSNKSQCPTKGRLVFIGQTGEKSCPSGKAIVRYEKPWDLPKFDQILSIDQISIDIFADFPDERKTRRNATRNATSNVEKELKFNKRQRTKAPASQEEKIKVEKSNRRSRPKKGKIEDDNEDSYTEDDTSLQENWGVHGRSPSAFALAAAASSANRRKLTLYVFYDITLWCL